MNPGDNISRYRILGPLGRGGMGVVYRAEDTRLHRQVALKFLPVDSVSDRNKLRFLNEARAAAAAHHPNICPIFDIEEEGGRVFIAMAFLAGETLHRRISAGPLAVGQTVSIAIQIANGLDCAHELGIVHRDIKASNIMLDPAGHASIMDFGLALQRGETRLTHDGSTVGTPGYMSPEQIRSEAVDGRTDIWSLGVLMCEMLTGAAPFARDNSIATIHAILNDPVPRLAPARPDAPPELIAVIQKALQKKPGDRWRQARDIAAELMRIEAAAASSATQTMTMTAVPATRRRGGRWMAGAALGAFLLVGIVLGYHGFTGAPEPILRAAGHPDIRHIAVLPFRLTVNDEKIRTITDGLVDTMTSALLDLPSSDKILAVPASDIRRRNISNTAEARRIDHVDFVVEGTAQPGGGEPGQSGPGSVECTITLQDAISGRRVDSRQFTFDTANPIASRDKAVEMEMKLLNIDLSPVAQTTLRAGDTSTPAAYSSYLQGRGFLDRYDVTGNIDKALASFQSAVGVDAHYALAWSGLAEAALRKARLTGDKKWSSMAMEDAERGVSLDGSLAIAHSVLGQVYAMAGREEAIGEFKKAIEIAPGNAEAPRELARLYNSLGRFDEAEASYVKATRSRPTDWYTHLLLGLFYYERERFQNAEKELKVAQGLTPDNDIPARNLGGIYTMQGRYKDAIAQFQSSLSKRNKAVTYASLGAAYFYEHRYRDAAAAAEAAIDLDSSNYFFFGNAGIYYKWIPGSEQKSASSLEHARDLAVKYLEAAPLEYGVRADLAEYRARLGDVRGALAEVGKIPASSRKPLAGRIALVYEMTGHRGEALNVLRANLSTAASLNQIRDDPDLAQLWNTAEMRQIAGRLR
ncbi:MAG: protein kinase [Terriglobia bacterium]